MAVSFVGRRNHSDGSTSTITVPHVAAVQEDDIEFLIVAQSEADPTSATFNGPSGWNQLVLNTGPQYEGTTLREQVVGMWWRQYVAADANPTVTSTWSGTFGEIGGSIVAFREVSPSVTDSATTIDPNTYPSDSDTSTPVSVNVPTAAASDFVVFLMQSSGEFPGADDYPGAPTGWTGAMSYDMTGPTGGAFCAWRMGSTDGLDFTVGNTRRVMCVAAFATPSPSWIQHKFLDP